ncbi:MAG: HDOD domain-containing protein [Woeseia sp.]
MAKTPHQVAYNFVERLAKDLQDARFELPAFPEAVLRVQRALQCQETSAGDIVDILGSDAGLAARILRIANSAAFRPASGEITDLRNAVSRLGFNMVRTVAVDFAMRQLRRRDNYSATARDEIEAVWRDSLKVASLSFVIAKHYTDVNADQALLTGLLHGLGRLYIVMRAEEMSVVSETDIRAVADGWQASIGKAILETWGLPEGLQHAVEHQDDRDTEPEIGDDGRITLTNILVAAKVLNSNPAGASNVPALSWLNVMNELDASAVLTQYDEEIEALRASLGD